MQQSFHYFGARSSSFTLHRKLSRMKPSMFSRPDPYVFSSQTNSPLISQTSLKSNSNSESVGLCGKPSGLLCASIYSQHRSYMSLSFSLCLSISAPLTVSRRIKATFLRYRLTVSLNISFSTKTSIAGLSLLQPSMASSPSFFCLSSLGRLRIILIFVF